MIPVYIINLPQREDRRISIVNEFADKTVFNATIVSPLPHEIPSTSLWITIKHILHDLVSTDADYIIICEDDHIFTPAYSPEFLLYNIHAAQKRNADILVGGVGDLNVAVPVSHSLLWLETFSGLQFTVIYRPFFEKILQVEFDDCDVADLKICALSDQKFIIYPTISTQKDFGYSDVTSKNNEAGRVDAYFLKTNEKLKALNEIYLYYQSINDGQEIVVDMDGMENYCIPTYVINLPQRTDRLAHIREQFDNKPEFDIVIQEAICKEPGGLGLWLTIRKIIQRAIDDDEDVIIICEDDHQFTDTYAKERLFRNIIQAHYQGAEVLSGGIGYFNHGISVANDRYWINTFYSTQFLVLYRKIFQKIIDEPFDESVTADDYISALSTNKMVIYPFISTQKEFGYSDININNATPGQVERLFKNTADKFEKLKSLYLMLRE